MGIAMDGNTRTPLTMVLWLVAMSTGCATPVLLAQTTGPSNPCAFQEIDSAKWGNQPLHNPPVEQATHGRLQTTLTVQYTDPHVTSLGGCPVTLRTYNGALVGPTLRVKPGETLNILLNNVLPHESPNQIAAQVKQEADSAFIETRPHSFNTTNLHTHGLHVSPVGNSDNVLLAIPPQTQLLFEIKVPANHPAGTYWYHAHAHGSTAIQVGSGMAGALIIEDDEATLPSALREATRREKILVLQTILYDAQGRAEDISAFFPDPPSPPDACTKGLPTCTWQTSKRRTTINGQIVPIITLRPGEVQRWRMIDAAFRESICVRLRKQGNNKEGIPLHEIALDGIYLGKIDTWSSSQLLDLEPGYRSDVLVQAPNTPGRYELIDAESGAGCPTPAASGSAASSIRSGLRGIPEPERVLAYVDIAGEPLPMALPTNAEMGALTYRPGVNLQTQADGVQEAIFKLGSAVHTEKDVRNYFQINYHAFNPNRVRPVGLGRTDMWFLTTVGDPPGVLPPQATIPPLPHVFHIHVNPFQTIRQDPQGRNELVWKDTLLVLPAAKVQIYTQYLDYLGQFVMHCHILDHEDLGMMEIVDVVGEQPVTTLPMHGGH
ncbi:MAG: multicopper oxidase family protein [Nitrospira sp.]|nr:multicopper oxidase family protein [Nitrospira sp.]